MPENKRKIFDEIVSDNVYKLCSQKDITQYKEIALIIGKSDSFVRAIYAKRKKFNLYHLVKLAYKLECKVDDFLPTLEEYHKKQVDGETVDDCFRNLIDMEEN